ncbi:MAG: hypothetical protein D6681_14350, partial [Calditrichaeota bacterium]
NPGDSSLKKAKIQGNGEIRSCLMKLFINVILRQAQYDKTILSIATTLKRETTNEAFDRLTLAKKINFALQSNLLGSIFDTERSR